MTMYAGETVVITHVATNETVELTDADVDAVYIEIFDSAGDVVVAETEMTWDDTQERWEYVWNTGGATPIDSGSYRALCTIDGLGGTLNWEYKKIRLARNPV